MKSFSLLEFRQQAQTVLRYVQKGQAVLLTYRGKPVARLEPVTDRADREDDPFYSLGQLAAGKFAESRGHSLTNDEMDRVIYGS